MQQAETTITEGSTCSACGHANAADNRYCGSCGVPLDTPGVSRELANLVQRTIRQDLEALLKDRDVVEVRLTAAVAERLTAWAKIYAVIIGSIITALSLLLGALGVQSYAELKHRITDATTSFEPKLAAARADLDKINHESQQITADLARRREQLARLDKIEPRLARLEDVIFEKSGALTPDLQQRLQESFDGFRYFLTGLGFRVTTPVKIAIDDADRTNAYYNANERRIVIGTIAAQDPDVIFREYTFRALQDVAGNGSPESTDSTVQAVSSGLADYFACSYLDNPVTGVHVAADLHKRNVIARDYIRKLNNNRSFSSIRDTGIDYHDAGEVWGGAFWAMRTSIGQAEIDRVLLTAWKRFQQSNVGAKSNVRFIGEILSTDKQLFGPDHEQGIHHILVQRGFLDR
jgi:hypothetical protein